MKRRVSIGVFTDHLIAIVTFKPNENDVYECHVDCERGIDRNDLLIALLNIEATVVKDWNIREVFGAVISKNRGVMSIANACGLYPDGVEHTVGSLRWVRVSKTYSDICPRSSTYDAVNSKTMNTKSDGQPFGITSVTPERTDFNDLILGEFNPAGTSTFDPHIFNVI